MDGQDLKLLDPLTFRRHLGIVPQVGLDTRSEFWLLSVFLVRGLAGLLLVQRHDQL